MLTVTGLVTLPLTYTLLRKSTDDERLAPRIKTDYKPQDGDAAQKLRSAHKRRQRKVTRALVTLLGWAIMGAMVYLIMTTARTSSKIWNPYDILGIADVSTHPLQIDSSLPSDRFSPLRRSRSSRTTSAFRSSSTPTK